MVVDKQVSGKKDGSRGVVSLAISVICQGT